MVTLAPLPSDDKSPEATVRRRLGRRLAELDSIMSFPFIPKREPGTSLFGTTSGPSPFEYQPHHMFNALRRFLLNGSGGLFTAVEFDIIIAILQESDITDFEGLSANQKNMEAMFIQGMVGELSLEKCSR